MLRFVLSAAIAGIAAPAMATDWDSVAGWDVYEIDGTRCAMGRVFVDADMSFGVIMSIDGEARIFATSARWPMRTGQSVAAQISLDDKVVLDTLSVGMQSERNRGFVAAADDAFLQGFAFASRMTVRAGSPGPSTTAALTGSAEALAQGRRCVAGLRGDRREAPALAARARQAGPPIGTSPSRTVRAAASPTPKPGVLAIATRAVPRASLATWVGDTDYPAAALRAGQEGATTVRIAIGTDGSVAECAIARSSGSFALDEETCRIFKRRARFKPARNTAGSPVDSVEQHTVRWKLPD